ncbi:uncharacterized protein isoform X14 [Leptinotarsa decemlineata]|uniref:uncharacterized protein isoform X14 n=1 Tax=Leptinotarsa decemlineata TaxID=7539 RepID=UPI003D30D776
MDNRNNMLQLCRLCLVKDDVNIPIFEEHGDIRQIFLKISSCLPVKVSREDKLPKKICDGCSFKLDTLYEFCNTSANAEKQLLTWLGEAGMNSQMVDGTITAVTQQIKPTDTFVKEETIEPPDIHNEDDDDKDYMFQQKFEESASAGPSATVTSNEEEEPPPKRARRTAAVKAAIALDHDSDDDDDDSGEPMTKVEDESEESEGEDQEPSFADAPSTSADDQPGPSGVGKDGVEAPLKISKKTRSSMKLRCQKRSSKETKENKSVDVGQDPDFQPLSKPTAKKTKHRNSDELLKLILENFTSLNETKEPLECSYCSKLFNTHMDFGLHSKFHNKDGHFSCHLCEYRKDTKKTFENHIRGHDLYKCQKCGKIMRSRRWAYKHLKAHTLTNNLQCEICGKHLKKESLATHLKLIHAEDRSSLITKCPICNKEYLNAGSLRQHYSRAHKELGIDISVVCDICGLRLSCKSKLKPHIMTHTGDKPFACALCPKKFVVKDKLNAHMRVHTGEKPYECRYCGKKFGQDGPYRYHIKTHTGEKSYSCPLCGKRFITKANMRIHLKSCNISNR